MTGDGPQIVIKGRRGDWPGGARTLTPHEPGREPNRQTFWFGAELDPDGSQVWFRITSEAVRRPGGWGPRSTASRFWSPMTATRGSSATAATEARPRPVAVGRLRLNGGSSASDDVAGCGPPHPRLVGDGADAPSAPQAEVLRAFTRRSAEAVAA